MVRKLALVLTGWWVVVAAPVWALGLGDIRLASSLNQNFDAAIELRDLADLRADEVIVSLGSSEDFARAGLERSFFLLDFHYTVELKGHGAGVVRVTSNRPVTEPVVEFLVNVVWPSGRLQRQYAVLLDPPRSAGNSASAAVAPARVSSGDSSNDGSAAEPTPPAADSRPAAHQRVERTARKSRFTGDSYGPTRRDDTLWRVAQRVRPSSEVTVQQTMLALQRVNPDAFINANINRLKAGVTLHVPDAQQIQQTGGSEAVAEVARQTEAWRGRGRSTPVETGAPVESTPAPASAATPAPRDELRIVAGAKGKPGAAAPGVNTKTATPPPAAKAELENQLAGSKEEQDRLNLELSEANNKLTGTAQQATQLQQQLALKDQQLAEANRALAQLRANAQRSTPAVAAPTVAVPAATGLLDTLAGKSLLAGAVALLAGLIAALFLYNRAKTQADATARAKAAVDERLERTMRMEKERTGNTMRGGIPLPAAAVAVATALPEVRATPAARVVPEPRVAPEPRPAPQSLATPIPAALSDTQETRDFDKTVLLENAGDLARNAARDDLVTASDVVSEADIYIAYGRFPQAISFLQSALEKEPERNDARLKLMEAYVETRDAGAFSLEAQTLLDRHPNEPEMRRARQLQARLVGVNVIPAEKLGEQTVDFDKTIIDTSLADRATNATVADATAPISLDLDLDRTDLLNETQSVRPLDVDLTLDQPVTSAAGSLDFNLTLDGLDDDEKGGQLGGDLGMSFRDDRRQAAGDFDRTADSAPRPTTDDDFGLDLTIDGRGTPVEPARRAVRPQVPDSDDGLSLTLDGKDEGFARPSRLIPDEVVNSDTVETTPIEEDLDFLSEAPDEARTKLDLARAYIDMGDGDAARDVLLEVLAEGSDAHQHEARELLGKLA